MIFDLNLNYFGRHLIEGILVISNALHWSSESISNFKPGLVVRISVRTTKVRGIRSFADVADD